MENKEERELGCWLGISWVLIILTFGFGLAMFFDWKKKVDERLESLEKSIPTFRKDNK